jgi:hypothetical protein
MAHHSQGIGASRMVLTMLAICLAGCAVPTADPTSGSRSTPTEESTATGGPSATPAGFSYVPQDWADFGSHATTLVDGLRVRMWSPGSANEVTRVLVAGDELFVLDGPIRTEGYSWYQVEFPTTPDAFWPDGYAVGWVAGQSDVDRTEWSIGIGPVSCPSEVDAATLARLTPWALHNCPVEVASVTGMLDLCYERGLTPFTYEPDWAAFSCLFLRDQANTWGLSLAFPPDVHLPELVRGDLVTLTGALGFDPGRYGACTVSGPNPPLEVERLLWAARCQDRFVVSGATIDGHVDLPPMY